jgi:hypothetical protein
MSKGCVLVRLRQTHDSAARRAEYKGEAQLMGWWEMAAISVLLSNLRCCVLYLRRHNWQWRCSPGVTRHPNNTAHIFMYFHHKILCDRLVLA